MKEYKSIKVSPELHQRFKVLAATEGKDMIDMLEILMHEFEHCVCKNQFEDYKEGK